MLRKVTEYKEIDERRLMDLYAEGNLENADYFYPDTADKRQAIEKVERDFLNYIETEFFSSPGNAYWILEENAVWVSALRLYTIDAGFYYMEALETHPDFRLRGYASKLLAGVIEELKKQGPFRLCDCVSKKNIASLKTHEKCGFLIVSDQGMDYLSNEVCDKDYSMEYRSFS